MTKEQHIEAFNNTLLMNYDMPEEFTKGLAEFLYDEGYRLETEGKWIWINQATGYLEPPYGDTCKCAICEFEIDVSETHFNYCPHCGAKMKGDQD